MRQADLTELDSGIPLPEGAELLHTRSYDVQSFREGEDRLRLRGRVRDVKPPGMTIEGDVEPLTIHDMIVDLVVAFPSLTIIDASVRMATHPHGECPSVVQHYRNLVGLSIARGYTHRVRELFGGPRGCTHTTALLQAMAPVAIQSVWSMHAASAQADPPAAADHRQRLGMNLNTCHVWAEDGPMFSLIDAGEDPPPPIWATERMVQLGRDPASWRAGRD